jgi:Mn-dependent DtxR family transcriptional regulator
MATDPENVNFLDLACLLKMSPETTLEKLGSLVNSSVFDAANIAGTLKQKGLIDFTAYYPGPSNIILTESGKKLEADVEAKSAEPLDTLDEEILRQMSSGKRYPVELASSLNVRPRDLTFRIYKLFKQSYLSYELKNGNVELMLTEQGFLKAKPTPVVQAPVMQAQQAPQVQAQTQGGEEQMSESQVMGQINEDVKKRKGRGRMLLVALVVVVLLVLVVLFLSMQGYIQLPFSLASL